MADYKKIVSTVFVKTARKAKRELLSSFNLGADIVEIRIDSFTKPEEAEKLFDLIGKHQIIFSGNRNKILKNELKVLLKAQKMGAFIDIPYVRDFKYPVELIKDRLIISYHSKITSYGNLEKLVKKISKIAKYIKIVPPKENLFFCCQFLKWTQRINRRYNLIVFPTGEESKFSRMISHLYGSKWIYSLSPNSQKTVEGQIELKELLNYHPKEISKFTQIIALIGYPLNFTFSPNIWNMWFKEKGIDAVYIPFKAKDIQNALESFKKLKIKFFAVTSPHKTSIINYLNKLSKKSEKAGSVNTVFESKDGTLTGFNTDIYGIRRTLSFLKRRRSILILGNGGVARSAIFALRKSHTIFLTSRDSEKGKSLCNEFQINFIPWEEKENGKYDIIINATSVGSDNISIPWNTEKPISAKYLLDLVVSPLKQTPFEKFAKKQGVKIIGGYKVLLNQAKLQFRIFSRLLSFNYF